MYVMDAYSSQQKVLYHNYITMTFKRTHWMSNTRFYRIYRWIKRRCNLPTDTNYSHYGARWIRCERKNFEDFRYTMYWSYLEHINKYWEKNTTIERIDVNWNYCIENCRRATMKEQGNNTRTNVAIKYDWVKYPSIEILCESLNLNYHTVYKRIFLDGQWVKEAIDDLKTKTSKYKYKWVTYKWITDLCRKLWLKRTSITYRLKIWMSLEDAIENRFRTYVKEQWTND